MEISQKLLKEIYNEIEKRNMLTNDQSIPHSDTFIKFLCANMGADEDVVRQVIRLLIEVHRVFAIEIVAEDTNHSIDKVEGYIVVDRSIIHDVAEFFKNQLMSLYQKQFKKNFGVHQIIKEVFPMMSSLNNTEIGKIANKTIMLLEYERLLEKDYAHYSYEWQEARIAELAKEVGFSYKGTETEAEKKEEVREAPVSSRPSIPGRTQKKNSRAIDTPHYREYAQKKESYPLKRILNIYGMKFFLQVNLRKYQFSYLKQLVMDKQIGQRHDLLLLRDMLDHIKANFQRDPKLEQYRSEIYDLESAVLHAMFFESKMRK